MGRTPSGAVVLARRSHKVTISQTMKFVEPCQKCCRFVRDAANDNPNLRTSVLSRLEKKRMGEEYWWPSYEGLHNIRRTDQQLSSPPSPTSNPHLPLTRPPRPQPYTGHRLS
jgi:hypothetical protein